jgi:hypothetical protein
MTIISYECGDMTVSVIKKDGKYIVNIKCPNQGEVNLACKDYESASKLFSNVITNNESREKFAFSGAASEKRSNT